MIVADTVSKFSTHIDSRDIIKRIEQLKEEFTVDLEDIDDVKRMADFDPDEVKELAELLELQFEAEGYCDWLHGATLIHEDYFMDYCKQYAEETGAVTADAPWPLNYIDWDAAAETFKMDFTEVEYGGETFYVRSV